MCGIAGIIRFDAQPIDRGALEAACRTLLHRGPDHQSTRILNSSRGVAGLAATRLAVMDPSPAGHQPMQDATGRYHLVFNGEVYNFPDLRRDLAQKGAAFRTRGDTEVVLAACVQWGPEAGLRFNGMWALAFYDAQTHSGFLSRDRFGIKPLCYAADGRVLRFASELPALVALGHSDTSPNPKAVAQHLAYGYIAHPDTIYTSVRRLEPGHVLSFTARGAGEPVRYYEPVTAAMHETTRDVADARVGVRRHLAESVALRRASDVPIGTFLSGGLDSSIVALHLAEVTGQRVCTFCVGYEGQRSYDESPFAREVAAAVGTEHHEITLTEGDVLAAIPGILDHLGEPVGDSSIIPTALMCRAARQFVTVALSGDGGDELFGGYWRYLGHEASRTYGRIPSFVRRLLIEPLLGLGGSGRTSWRRNRARQLGKLLRATMDDPLARHLSWSRILAPQANGLFRDPQFPVSIDAEFLERGRKLTAALKEQDPLNRILAFDLQHQLPADMLQKVDLASMKYSLEVRLPFLDRRVVEFALPLPSACKVHRGLRKRLLVEAYRGRLPDAVLDRPKQGFEVPIGEYLRGPMRSMFLDVVTPKALGSFGFLCPAAAEDLYRQHVERRFDHADVLFALLSLCWWSRGARERGRKGTRD